MTPTEVPLGHVRIERNFAAGPVDARVGIVAFSAMIDKELAGGTD